MGFYAAPTIGGDLAEAGDLYTVRALQMVTIAVWTIARTCNLSELCAQQVSPFGGLKETTVHMRSNG